MTLREFEALVAAVEFRRGWRLGVRVDDPMRPTHMILTVYATVENARGKGIIKIQSDRILMAAEIEEMDEDQATRWLWHVLLEADEHEAREWFRVRGVRFHDPHVPHQPMASP